MCSAALIAIWASALATGNAADDDGPYHLHHRRNLYLAGTLRLAGMAEAGRQEPATDVSLKPDHAAEHMREALTRSRDRAAVLHRFVDGLSQDDASLLRDLVRDRESQ